MEKRFEMFTTLIAQCSRFIKRIKTLEMAEYNLKSLHVSCLYYLYVNDGAMTATELCEICDEDKAYVSRSLEYLEKEDYIISKSKTEKKYKSPIFLTKKGNEVAQIICKKIDKIVNDASTGLLEEDRKTFYSSLMLISNNLKKIIENYGENNGN